MDWRIFVESVSIIDSTLHTDPAGVYAGMDFITRDRYRHCVESLARQSGVAEEKVARAAIQLATEAAARDGIQARTAHVGFYLIDNGRSRLEHLVHVPWSPLRLLKRTVHRRPLLLYVSFLSVITAATASLVLVPIGSLNRHDWQVWLLLVLGIISASQVAVALVNLMTTITIAPHRLPRLDFAKVSRIPAAPWRSSPRL